MSASVVIFVEEPSIRIIIEEICRKFDVNEQVRVLQHEGKNDLEQSIRRKINAWRSAKPPKFIVSRDLDSGERASVKLKLLELVPDHAKPRTKIRIIVPELEAWYLGDAEALATAGYISRSMVSKFPSQSQFRNLCLLKNAKQEFYRLIGRRVGQIATAHTLAPLLDPGRNRSANFQAFISALKWATQDTERR